MPTVEENSERWGREYDWVKDGDEWSSAWGGPAMQWYGTLLPRIQRFVPTGNVLEIACGFGRWTHYLKHLCDHLVAIDLSDKCIETCLQRFPDDPKIEFHVNDGKSLDMVSDSSVDFVFSFDSLVHADLSVLEAYISQLPRILKIGGAAFLHHSNLGTFVKKHNSLARIPGLGFLLSQLGLMNRVYHWRDKGVSAELVAEMVDANDLVCANQEIVHWGSKHVMIDCFTTIVTRDSPYAGEKKTYINKGFMQEAGALSRLSRFYQGSR